MPGPSVAMEPSGRAVAERAAELPGDTRLIFLRMLTLLRQACSSERVGKSFWRSCKSWRTS